MTRLMVEKLYVTAVFSSIVGGVSLGQSFSSLGAFSKGKVAGYKLLEIIKQKPNIIKDPSSGICLAEVKGNIEFKNVTFSYPSRPDVTIFQGFSMSIPAGKSIAIVGGSGSGKSTIISMIERFYDPSEGHILMDNVNIKTLQLIWLHNQIGLVNQEPALFATTILENILYGKPGESMDDVEIASAAANAHSFITLLPNGYNTQVGERGVQLSGGQKQRIVIARAMLKNPKILLLDEATSALDVGSEQVVQEALDYLMVGRTTVVVAHRLSTIRNVDSIAVLQLGRVVDTDADKKESAQQNYFLRLLKLNAPEWPYIVMGVVGSILSGIVLPTFALMMGNLIECNGRSSHYQNKEDDACRSTNIEPDDPDAEPVENIHGEIALSHVNFSYPTRPDVIVFKDFNLRIPAGHSQALFGASGSGKSSVIALIERFYDPISGKVIIDGKDIRRLNLQALRRRIGLVQQEPVLFATSITDNIKYGKDDASEAEVMEAARVANVHTFISSLPEGYKTSAGERGVQLSGGQKQRIAIARAVLRDPKILLLDEATIAVDAESEYVLQEALERLMRGRTTVLVAHRLSTIQGVDSIGVVEDGQIVEQGSHSELIRQPDGIYSRFLQLQNHQM
uniref:ABC transporter domain-containing protein n=1 Tax=Daucus carota subsp. sativus TaxID=79200 RepID=A0A166DZW5_DAUCS